MSYHHYVTRKIIDELLDNDCIAMHESSFRDVRGREIYDGDILLLLGKSQALGLDCKLFAVIRSQELQFGICRAGCFELLAHDADFEIMGNIYENPELLT